MYRSQSPHVHISGLAIIVSCSHAGLNKFRAQATYAPELIRQRKSSKEGIGATLLKGPAEENTEYIHTAPIATYIQMARCGCRGDNADRAAVIKQTQPRLHIRLLL